MYKATIFMQNYVPDSVFRKTLDAAIKKQLEESVFMSHGTRPFEIVGYEQVSKGNYREVYRQKYDPHGNPIP